MTTPRIFLFCRFFLFYFSVFAGWRGIMGKPHFLGWPSCRGALETSAVDWSSPVGVSCLSAMLRFMAGGKPGRPKKSVQREALSTEDGYREAWGDFMPQVLAQDKRMMRRIDDLLKKEEKSASDIRELDMLLKHRKAGVDRKYGLARARTETSTTHSLVTQNVADLVSGPGPSLPSGMYGPRSRDAASSDDVPSDVIEGEVVGSTIEEFGDHV